MHSLVVEDKTRRNPIGMRPWHVWRIPAACIRQMDISGWSRTHCCWHRNFMLTCWSLLHLQIHKWLQHVQLQVLSPWKVQHTIEASNGLNWVSTLQSCLENEQTLGYLVWGRFCVPNWAIILDTAGAFVLQWPQCIRIESFMHYIVRMTVSFVEGSLHRLFEWDEKRTNISQMNSSEQHCINSCKLSADLGVLKSMVKKPRPESPWMWSKTIDAATIWWFGLVLEQDRMAQGKFRNGTCAFAWNIPSHHNKKPQVR